ncbi:MAG: CoA transferase [Acidimicrobiales bacterium]
MAVTVDSGWNKAVRFADQAIDRLSALGIQVPLGATELMSMRALFSDPEQFRQQSMGGKCRLLQTSDGWCAVHLPREDDLELLPAWLGLDFGHTEVPWGDIAMCIAIRTSADAAGTAQELGLAVAAVPQANEDKDEQLIDRGTTHPARPWIQRRVGRPAAEQSLRGALVVDLSSLWAGPLCTRILSEGGARVIKIESTSRPDASRNGDQKLFDWLHAKNDFRMIDFEQAAGVAELVSLLEQADVIIEGSRPRALDRLGISPVEVLAKRPGVVWVSITAFGRCGPWRDRVGFGDDAAAAGGLVEIAADGSPGFVGDAVADPLTGLVCAALAVDAFSRGGGVTIDVAMREVARSAGLSSRVVW